MKAKQKILLVNQHSSNHGDEAAGKALTRNVDFQGGQVSILYNAVSKNAIIDFGMEFKQILLTQTFDLIEKSLVLLSFVMPVKFLSRYFPENLKNEFNIIKNNDMIISMPGGANLGLYNDWRYLWRLYVALKLGKHVAIYSISIGPFSQIAFKMLTKYVLTNVDFLSLRDAQSFRYANEMDVKYIKSIDTAFLQYTVDEQFDLKSTGVSFASKDYVVMVPNDLTSGHKTFKNYNPDKLECVYVSIIEYLLVKDMNIVFLPQLFANGNDSNYFKKLIDNVDDEFKKNIVIIDENLSSDVQQNIIRNAFFVIGARYHSIVFSINNSVPFLCLSYENKMKNTLEILGLENYGLDLTKLPNNYNLASFKSEARDKINNLINKEIDIDNTQAKEIAKDCFTKFQDGFLNRFSGR